MTPSTLIFNKMYLEFIMKSRTSIKIVMDLPRGVDPKIIDKIGEYMPVDVFFDGVLDYVYNDCMRNMLEVIDMVFEDIEDAEVRKERETAVLDLVNDNLPAIASAFRKELMLIGLFFGINKETKWKVEQVVYDQSNESLAARIVEDADSEEDEDESAESAAELIDQENEDEDADSDDEESSQDDDDSEADED